MCSALAGAPEPHPPWGRTLEHQADHALVQGALLLRELEEAIGLVVAAPQLATHLG